MLLLTNALGSGNPNPAKPGSAAIQHYLVRVFAAGSRGYNGITDPDRVGYTLSYTTSVHEDGTGREREGTDGRDGTGRDVAASCTLLNNKARRASMLPTTPVGPVIPIMPVGPVMFQ